MCVARVTAHGAIREDAEKPMVDLDVRKPADFLARLLPQGSWARCTRCGRVRKGAVTLYSLTTLACELYAFDHPF